MPESLTTVIQPIAEDILQGRLAAFCGAGISINSGLASADTLIRDVLRLLDVDEDVVEDIRASGVPFELVMHVLADDFGVDHLIDAFRRRTPNANHILLAKLIRDGRLRLVYTTNFDELIETALEQEGLREGVEYAVHRTSADLERAHWATGCAHVVKLHGTVSDPGSIAMTVADVAAQRLSVVRANALAKLFNTGAHTSVLVLGYSFSDVFDINPALESTPVTRTVYVVEHEASAVWRPAEALTEDIQARAPQNPLHHATGVRIRADTDQLVRQLWSRCLDEPYPDQNREEDAARPSSYFPAVQEYLKQKDDAPEMRAHCVASMLMDIGRLNDAKQVISDLLKQRADAATWHGGVLMNTLGIIAKNTGRYYEAIEHFELANAYSTFQGLLNEAGDYSHGIRLSNLASAYARIGENVEAKRCCEEALAIAIRMGDLVAEGKRRSVLGGIHLSLGDASQAIVQCSRAVEIARESGDKDGEWRALSNLGSALHASGKVRDAVAHFDNTWRVVDHLGMTNVGASIQLSLGLALRDLGETARAMACVHQAIQHATLAGDARTARIGRAALRDLQQPLSRERRESK